MKELLLSPSQPKAGVPMPVETLVPLPTSDSAAPVQAPAALDQVVRAIAGDAASAAGEYLRDTEVPHGGE
jgi:hypothetical protein